MTEWEQIVESLNAKFQRDFEGWLDKIEHINAELSYGQLSIKNGELIFSFEQLGDYSDIKICEVKLKNFDCINKLSEFMDAIEKLHKKCMFFVMVKQKEKISGKEKLKNFLNS